MIFASWFDHFSALVVDVFGSFSFYHFGVFVVDVFGSCVSMILVAWFSTTLTFCWDHFGGLIRCGVDAVTHTRPFGVLPRVYDPSSTSKRRISVLIPGILVGVQRCRVTEKHKAFVEVITPL